MLSDLKLQLSKLTPSERKVADFILQNPTEVSYFTVQQLADKAATSTATIMRLSGKMGFSGFAELQTSLQTFLKTSHTPKSRLKSGLKSVGDDELWTKTLSHYSEQIATLISTIDKSSLEQGVALLDTAKKIIITSARSGLATGQFLAQNLSRIRDDVAFMQADLSDWLDDALSLGEQDVLIAISFARYAKRIADFASIAKQKGASVIVLTDSYTAPIVDFGDVVLVCPTDSLSFYHSPIAGMIVAEYLISALAKIHEQRTSDRLDEVAMILKQIGYHC